MVMNINKRSVVKSVVIVIVVVVEEWDAETVVVISSANRSRKDIVFYCREAVVLWEVRKGKEQ